MSFLDKFVDKEKVASASIRNPREIFNEILKQTSGSAFTRDVRFNIFYQIWAFKGVVEGVGTSTLVANTALALANAGLTVCVIDTSIMAPVQDILLKTDIAVESDTAKEILDWFDLPFTRNSVLHVSKLSSKVSVLSFKGKGRTVLDALSTNDSDSLVEMAFSSLHTKFDIILVDTCQELTTINTACLQQAQQIIQVWSDSPTVLGNLENFVTNQIILSCPLDKMRNVVVSMATKDVIGDVDPLIKQYRLKKITTNYLSEEISMLLTTGKSLYQAESTDDLVIEYTNCIIDIICVILNIYDKKQDDGLISSNDIMEGKVDGTLHKEIKDFNDKFAEEHPDVVIERPESVNDLGKIDANGDGVVDADEIVDHINKKTAAMDANGDGFVDGKEIAEAMTGDVEASDDKALNSTLEDDIPDVPVKKSIFGKKRRKG